MSRFTLMFVVAAVLLSNQATVGHGPFVYNVHVPEGSLFITDSDQWEDIPASEKVLVSPTGTAFIT
ncbi:MAG: hypothetical protein JSU86_20700 [Phycisphaerales bacterium]|nr:MAG: hypothetical protein JSU86_20700 [Phycisphaerales bacterium]